MDITIDHKLNIIIVLLVVLLGVFLGYVIIGRGEGYATPLECANCLQQLDAKGKCAMINGYSFPTGCKESAFANTLLMEARTNSKYNPKTNLCDNYFMPCDGGAQRGECTAEPQTQFVYVHNPDGTVYRDEKNYYYLQDAQCPEGKVVIDKEVTGNGFESLYTYKCCPK